MKNPYNYGGCLSVRRKWLMAINGYEEHPVFSSGFHANGLDIYTRLKNFGMAIMWSKDLRLYHPYHHLSLTTSARYAAQKTIIDWRAKTLIHKPIQGIDPKANFRGVVNPTLLKTEFKPEPSNPKKRPIAELLKRLLRCILVWLG